MSAQDFNPRSLGGRGFSLLEVVMAAGLCAGTLGAVLAMLPPLLHAMTEATQRATALRVASAWEARWASSPFQDVVVAVESGEIWFADASGSRIGLAADPIWLSLGSTMAERDGSKRYELMVRRDAHPSGAAVVVYTLVVRWPAFTGDGRRITDPALQSGIVLKGSRTR